MRGTSGIQNLDVTIFRGQFSITRSFRIALSELLITLSDCCGSAMIRFRFWTPLRQPFQSLPVRQQPRRASSGESSSINPQGVAMDRAANGNTLRNRRCDGGSLHTALQLGDSMEREGRIQRRRKRASYRNRAANCSENEGGKVILDRESRDKQSSRSDESSSHSVIWTRLKMRCRRELPIILLISCPLASRGSGQESGSTPRSTSDRMISP